jgi:peptidoglycan hydrolase-like protein with peptidoglycan-binding domain
MIKKGSVSQEVARWQKFLNLPADGIFGEGTEKATIAFQTANGLRADGIVGDSTLNAAAAKGFVIKTESAGYYPPRPAFGSPDAAERARLFGRFDWKRKNSTDITIVGDWAQKNIVKVTIPQLKGVTGAPRDGVVLFHKAGAAQLRGFFAEVEKQGLLDLVISWAGSFYPRFIRGSQNSLSNHSWGTAFDINAPENWLGAKPAPVGAKGSLLKLVPIANSFGFYWGGHYNSRLDGMHFELSVVGMFPKQANSAFNPIIVPKAKPTLDFAPTTARTDSSEDAVQSGAEFGKTSDPSVIAQKPSDASDNLAGGSWSETDAPQTNEASKTSSQATASAPEGGTAQAADVIANVGNDTATIEAAQKLPDTKVAETSRTGLLGKTGAVLTGIFTGEVILPQFLQNGLSFDVVIQVVRELGRFLWEMKFWIIGILVIWHLSRKLESLFIRNKAVSTNTDPTKGTVVVTETAGAPTVATDETWFQSFRRKIGI